MKVAVLGAGNGGQAISAYLSLQGHSVSLYHHRQAKVDSLLKRGKKIGLVGRIEGEAELCCISTNLSLIFDSLPSSGCIIKPE